MHIFITFKLIAHFEEEEKFSSCLVNNLVIEMLVHVSTHIRFRPDFREKLNEILCPPFMSFHFTSFPPAILNLKKRLDYSI